MGDFRWKGYLMGAVLVRHERGTHYAIHLWTPTNDASLCGRLRWSRDVVDKDVATGWPDCNDCAQEAFRRIVTAA